MKKLKEAFALFIALTLYSLIFVVTVGVPVIIFIAAFKYLIS